MESLTREEEQKRINDLYAYGKITKEDWSAKFDELSSSRWTAKGKVIEPKKN
jgi:hypothetical protein